MMSDTERELQEQMEGLEYTRRLPQKGWGKNRVIEEIKKMMQLGKGGREGPGRETAFQLQGIAINPQKEPVIIFHGII